VQVRGICCRTFYNRTIYNFACSQQLCLKICVQFAKVSQKMHLYCPFDFCSMAFTFFSFFLVYFCFSFYYVTLTSQMSIPRAQPKQHSIGDKSGRDKVSIFSLLVSDSVKCVKKDKKPYSAQVNSQSNVTAVLMLQVH